MSFCRLLIGILALMPLGGAFANDEGVDALYEAALPEDAAFIRFIGFQPNETPEVFGFKIPENARGTTDYIVVRADRYEGLQPSSFLTVLPAKDRSILIFEDTERDRLKVLVSLINLTASDQISLQTSKGEVTLIEALGPREVGYRLVNPISVGLAVFDEDELLD
ncbi:alginate O-acetyltransferase AlgF, partial [Cognatishimia activa]